MAAVWQNLLERFPAQEVVAEERRFSYRAAGDGPDLVLLHGIGSGSASWVHQLDFFQASHRVTAWDAPGYGNSELLDRAKPVASDYANALAAFLRALGIKRVILVAHSLGALMAGAFAAARTGNLRGLVFAAPAQGYAKAPAEIRRRKLADRLSAMERLGPEGLARVRSGNLLSAGAASEALALVEYNMARLTVAGHAAAAQLLAGGDLAQDAARADLPTLVLCGDADSVTPPKAVRTFSENLPDAEYREISAAGHACYVEQPAAFNRIVGDYAEGRP